MEFTHMDVGAIWLTLKLASTVTVILLLLGTPIAWWLATTRSFWKGPVSAIVALPLVLPPTVIGFYLLVVMGPNGPVGRFTESLGLGLLPFTFWGLVVASIFYSLPFVGYWGFSLVNGHKSLQSPRFLASERGLLCIFLFFLDVLLLSMPLSVDYAYRKTH